MKIKGGTIVLIENPGFTFDEAFGPFDSPREAREWIDARAHGLAGRKAGVRVLNDPEDFAADFNTEAWAGGKS